MLLELYMTKCSLWSWGILLWFRASRVYDAP